MITNRKNNKTQICLYNSDVIVPDEYDKCFYPPNHIANI